MSVFLRGITTAAILITILFSSRGISLAQETAPTTGQSATASTSKALEGASPAATKPPAPEPDFWTQETMTGDWGGTRSRWKEKGIELEFKYVGIFQSIASGGIDDRSTFTNKLETTWKFDLSKVAGWKFWSSEIKAEWRFGGPALTGTGGINFTNVEGVGPAPEGSVVSVTALNFTRIIPKDLTKGDVWVISFGRFNILDLIDEDFFGGAGEERFLNIAPIGHRDGWGLFTQLSVADKDTSPITRFLNVGLGGNGLIATRRDDEFGLSYAYTNLSSVLKDNIDLVSFGFLRLQPEQQFEGFYNLHITPWLRLTGDLQIIRGVRPRVDTAVVPGARLEVIF